MLLSSFAIIITKQLISSVTWPSTGSKPLPIAGPLWPSCTVKGSDKTPHRTAPTVRLTFNSNPNPNPSRPVRSGAFTVRGIWRFKVGHWPTHARQKKIEKKHSDVDKNTKKTEEEEEGKTKEDTEEKKREKKKTKKRDNYFFQKCTWNVTKNTWNVLSYYTRYLYVDDAILNDDRYRADSGDDPYEENKFDWSLEATGAGS